jgi:hypothetical protein
MTMLLTIVAMLSGCGKKIEDLVNPEPKASPKSRKLWRCLV